MLKALEQSRRITEVPNFCSVPQHVICFIDSALLRHANQCCALPAGTEGVNEAFRIIARDGVCDHEERPAALSIKCVLVKRHAMLRALGAVLSMFSTSETDPTNMDSILSQFP